MALLIRPLKNNKVKPCKYSIGILILMLVACTPKSKISVLNFFFDGVPKPPSKEVAVASETSSPNSQENDKDTLGRSNQLPFLSYHEPYKQKKCEACHDKYAVGELIIGEPQLCYGCHDDFNNQYEKLHGPVDVGFCSSCHQPHTSKNEKLVSGPGNELCFPCHVKSEVERPKEHLDIGDALCISCHNPHGENKARNKRKPIPVGR